VRRRGGGGDQAITPSADKDPIRNKLINQGDKGEA
jgi:hypothetical protein